MVYRTHSNTLDIVGNKDNYYSQSIITIPVTND